MYPRIVEFYEQLILFIKFLFVLILYDLPKCISRSSYLSETNKTLVLWNLMNYVIIFLIKTYTYYYSVT